MPHSATRHVITAGEVGQLPWDLVFTGPGRAYLDRAHIFLWVNDLPLGVGGGAGTPGFTWVHDTRVSLVGYVPALNDKLEFRRTIPNTDLYRQFTDGAGLTEAQLRDQSLANLYAIHEVLDGYGTGTVDAIALAKAYANAPENVEVEPGQFSSFHFSAKSEDWSEVSRLWAEEAENVEVAPGEYSAKHHSAKSLGHAGTALAHAGTALGHANDAQGFSLDSQGYAGDSLAHANTALGHANAAEGFAQDAEDTVLAIASIVASPLNFGAVGDGVVDDTVAMQAALNYSPQQLTLDLMGRTYRMTAPLTLRSNLILQNGILDFSGVAGNVSLITASGSLGHSQATVGNISLGVTTINLGAGNTVNFSADDYIWVESNAQYNSVDPGTLGEIQRIDYTSSSLLYLRDASIMSYLVADVSKVTLFNHVENIKVENIEVRGNSAAQQDAFVFLYTRNVHVTRSRINGCSRRGVRFTSSITFSVTKCHIRDCNLAGLGYGSVATEGCHWYHFNENYYENCRHAVDNGGTRGQNRFWTANYNTCVGCTSAAISTHRQSDMWTICGNKINGGIGAASDSNGITVRSINGIIDGNQIIQPFAIGIGVTSQVTNLAGRKGYLQITNNTIELPGGGGIHCLLYGAIQYKSLVITGNSIRGVSGTSHALFVRVNGAGVLQGMTVDGNSITDMTGTGRSIYVLAENTATVNYGSVSHNTILRDVGGNVAISLASSSTVELRYIAVIGNSILGGTYNILGTFADRLTVVGNITRGSSVAATAGLGVNSEVGLNMAV